MMGELSHFDGSGASRMVDVSSKAVTERSATASGLVRMAPETLALILDRRMSKGDVFAVARLAGIMAAKRTGDLIPLCHPLGIDGVTVDLEAEGDSAVKVEATVTVQGRTGVEMGGAHGGLDRRTHGLRHVQGGRSRDRDRLRPAGVEVRRPERRLSAR